MGRAGLVEDDDFDNWASIRWRGAVTSAIRGKRGQAFLKEMQAALDALPAPKLIAHDLITNDGCVCALGAVGKARSMDMDKLDPYDIDTVAGAFGLVDALAREIVYVNDEDGPRKETDEQRYSRVLRWIKSQIIQTSAPSNGGNNG